MFLHCESAQFPHDRDYDGTDANHLPVIPGHDLSSGSKPKEDDNHTPPPASTEPESEGPAEQPPGPIIRPKKIMPILTTTEAKHSTCVVQGRA